MSVPERWRFAALRGSTHAVEWRACDLCGADEPVPLRFENRCVVCRCGRCDLIYVNPRPILSSEALDAFRYKGRESEELEFQQRKMQPVWDIALPRMQALLGRRGRMVDVGCGFGAFLARAKSEGWDPEGLDASETAVRHARETSGCPVQAGRIEEWTGAPGTFDAVTMWCLLEHVESPRVVLALAAKLLRPGGLVVVRVPNTAFYRCVNPVLSVLGKQTSLLWGAPDHVFGFSPKTIRRYLRGAGFAGVVVETSPLSAEAGGYTTAYFGETMARPANWLLSRCSSLLHRSSGGRLVLSPSLVAFALKAA